MFSSLICSIACPPTTTSWTPERTEMIEIGLYYGFVVVSFERAVKQNPNDTGLFVKNVEVYVCLNRILRFHNLYFKL